MAEAEEAGGEQGGGHGEQGEEGAGGEGGRGMAGDGLAAPPPAPASLGAHRPSDAQGVDPRPERGEDGGQEG